MNKLNKININRINIINKYSDSEVYVSDTNAITGKYTIGTLIVRIHKDKEGREYVNRILKVAREPKFTKNKVNVGTDSNYNYAVPVVVVLDSVDPIYIKPGSMHPMVTKGNTLIDSKDTTTGKKKAYKEYERIVGLMLRSK